MVDMVEANSVIPLYKQIVRALSDSIANGTYRPGDKLPTEAELIEQFGVSRITGRSAIKEMEDAGLVERARGKGTFVSSDTQMYAADDRESFTHSCQLAGKHRGGSEGSSASTEDFRWRRCRYARRAPVHPRTGRRCRAF